MSNPLDSQFGGPEEHIVDAKLCNFNQVNHFVSWAIYSCILQYRFPELWFHYSLINKHHPFIWGQILPGDIGSNSYTYQRYLSDMRQYSRAFGIASPTTLRWLGFRTLIISPSTGAALAMTFITVYSDNPHIDYVVAHRPDISYYEFNFNSVINRMMASMDIKTSTTINFGKFKRFYIIDFIFYRVSLMTSLACMNVFTCE